MRSVHLWLRQSGPASLTPDYLGEYHESVAGASLQDEWQLVGAGCTAQEGREHGRELYAS
jgi:hypothetical protein